jgi:hypothetical protein
MTKRLSVSAALMALIVIYLTLAVFTTRGQGGGVARQTWEYRVIGLGGSVSTQQAQLNALGADGWELVSVANTPPPGLGFWLYLKRPR